MTEAPKESGWMPDPETVRVIVAWLRREFSGDDYGGGDLAHWIADEIASGTPFKDTTDAKD